MNASRIRVKGLEIRETDHPYSRMYAAIAVCDQQTKTHPKYRCHECPRVRKWKRTKLAACVGQMYQYRNDFRKL